MPRWLTEDPSTFVWMCAIAAALCFAIFLTRRARGPLIVGFVAAGLALGAVLIDYLVITDREAIELTLGKLEAAFEEEDVDAVLALLADSFRVNGLDRAATERVLRELVRVTEIRRLRILVRQLDIAADHRTATVRIEAIADGTYSGNEFSLYRTSWLLTFVKQQGNRWLLLRANATGNTRIPRFRR